MPISCIIPFYNEMARIRGVIKELLKVEQISQIICVDDGSTDKSRNLSVKNSRVLIVRQREHSGKASTVFNGLKYVKSENILLMDADLKKLKHQEIEVACQKFTRDKTIDALILKIVGNNQIIDRILNKYIFQGGNRFLRKKDLVSVKRLLPLGYQLEVAINQYLINNRKNIYWMECSAVNPHSLQKMGMLNGIKKELSMDVEILSYLGPINYLRQIFFFPAKEIT